MVVYHLYTAYNIWCTSHGIFMMVFTSYKRELHNANEHIIIESSFYCVHILYTYFKVS